MAARELPGHIGINAVFLEPRMGGLDTMVRAVLPELVEAAPGTRFSVFCNAAGREHLAAEDWAGGVDLVTHPLLGRRGLRAVSELTLLGALAPRRGVELLCSMAMTAPLRTRAVNVVMIADVIWLVAPDPGAEGTYGLWRRVVPRVARRADRILTISEAAKRDIVEHLARPADTIDVVLPGFGSGSPPRPTDEQTLRARLDLGDARVLLAVSAKLVHKNLARLVEALPRIPDAVLVLPGNPTAHEQELRTLAGRLGVADRVRFPPYVSAEDLEGLYALAAVFVFPSLHEGFGLPILEAMRRGVPVACADASALPEVAGGAARYFDPHSPEAIAAAVGELLRDPGDLVARGRERAAEFTWSRCADQMLDAFARAWAQRAR